MTWIRNRSTLVALVAALAIFVAACGDSGGDDPAIDAPAAADADDGAAPGDGGAQDPQDAVGELVLGDGEVAIQSFEFRLQPVAAGSDVGFANLDAARHTLTADDGGFDTGEVSPNAEGSFTAPADAGDYAIHCEVHPNITATLVVE